MPVKKERGCHILIKNRTIYQSTLHELISVSYKVFALSKLFVFNEKISLPLMAASGYRLVVYSREGLPEDIL